MSLKQNDEYNEQIKEMREEVDYDPSGFPVRYGKPMKGGVKHMNNITKFLIGLLALLLTLWLVQGAFATQNDNVRICHKNNGNGWSNITVDDDAVNGQGNGDHNTSQHQGGQDIIPPGSWDSNGRNWTQQNQAIWNNGCNAVVPTSTPTMVPPTATPTLEPTVTPTLEPTITEMPDYCEEEGYQPYGPCESEITPEPTREVTPVVTETPRPASIDNTLRNDTTSTPECRDSRPVKVNDIWMDRDEAGNGTLVLRWGTSESYERVNIVYGLSPHDMRYSLLNTEDDGYEAIHGLDNGTHYWFAVQYQNGCMPGELSDWIDPLP